MIMNDINGYLEVIETDSIPI